MPLTAVPGDSDLFFGLLLGNGIPDTCDPTPTELTSAPGGQPIDHDGDGFANSGDNCPTLYNPDQLDTDVKVGDGIGDVCDTPGLDGGTDCVGEGCTAGIPRPIPSRTVSGNGRTCRTARIISVFEPARLLLAVPTRRRYTDALGQANVDATDHAAVVARHATRSRWTSMAPQVID